MPQSEGGVVWCDTSSIGRGVILEIDDIVENSKWLRKKDNLCHKNVSKLDTVIKGFNLASKW